MTRFLNSADVVLKEISAEIYHFYFFGEDLLGVSACYNIRPDDVWESTVEYGDKESFIEEIHDMWNSGHYKLLKGSFPEVIEYKGGEI